MRTRLRQRSFFHDIPIAVSARELGATVVTLDTADFGLITCFVDVTCVGPWPVPQNSPPAAIERFDRELGPLDPTLQRPGGPVGQATARSAPPPGWLEGGAECNIRPLGLPIVRSP